MLSEAMIKISSKDRANLSSYIHALNSIVSKLLKSGGMPYPTVLQELNEFSSKWDTKVAKNLKIRYEYIRDKRKGQYFQEWTTININLTHFVKVKPSTPDPYIISMDVVDMAAILFHEFTHYKQDMKIRSKHFGRYLQALGHKDFKSYLKNPRERQAWAIQYVEFLRRKMKIAKPEEILGQLRKMGLLHDATLNNLKSSDYDSWKAIMKNAVMTALHDLENLKKPSRSR